MVQNRAPRIKQSIPRQGTLESIVPEIVAHDFTAQQSDGQIHIDCQTCRQLCRRCLASLGMTPQDYLDSFDALPSMSLGGHMRPEILKEVAEILVLEDMPPVGSPWERVS